MHNKGILQTIEPSIEREIELATGAFNEDVWSDVQTYLEILFTEEQQNQIRLDRLMRESQQLDNGGEENSEARNVFQYMDYNPPSVRVRNDLSIGQQECVGRNDYRPNNLSLE